MEDVFSLRNLRIPTLTLSACPRKPLAIFREETHGSVDRSDILTFKNPGCPVFLILCYAETMPYTMLLPILKFSNFGE